MTDPTLTRCFKCRTAGVPLNDGLCECCGEPEVCGTCDGTGIDPARAVTPLAFPQFVGHVAALFPCLNCEGSR